jgi:hypothetical protein
MDQMKGQGGAKKMTKGAGKGALEAAGEKVREFVGDDGRDSDKAPRRRQRQEEE